MSYPWVPPTCSHCSELGHIQRNCLKWTPPKEPVNQSTKTSEVRTPAPSARNKRGKQKDQVYVRVAPVVGSATPSTDHLAASTSSSAAPPVAIPTAPPDDPPTGTMVSFAPASSFSSPPAPTPRRPLKRSRSSPLLSPPLKSDSSAFRKKQTPI